MRAATLTLVICLAAGGAPPATASDGIDMEYSESSGMKLSFGGVPVIRGSSLQVHSPDWKQGFYSGNSSPRQIETDASNRTVVVRHSTKKHVLFDATETWKLLDRHRLEVSVRGQLRSDAEACLEWTLGYINAFALYGGSWTDRSTVAGQSVAVLPQAAKPDQNPTVIDESDSIELASPLGTLIIRARSPATKLSLLDGRMAPQRWWAQDRASFWLGCLNVKLRPHEPLELRVVIEYRPADASVVSRPFELAGSVIRVDRVFEPATRAVHVVPTPKRFVPGDGELVLNPFRTIGGDAEGASVLAKSMQRRFGVAMRTSEPNQPARGHPQLHFVRDESLSGEGYSIRCSNGELQVRASGRAGFAHAVHTLMQLARVNSAGSICFPTCEIDDEPSLAFRGVHLFPGKDAIEFHRRLIERVIAPLKFNHVVLECEYTQWDSAREIWVDISVPREQIAEYVRIIRENGMEPIPLVQSLGHSGWMFKNGQNLDLAEDPDTPAAYDATNPRTYEFMNRIYEEAIALFEPKYFHIGHDEVTLFGRYPNRETSRQWGVTRLLLSDVDHWVRFFRARKIIPMMWGDMLLARDEVFDAAASAETEQEARARREQLPRDVIICDWHYDALQPDRFPSLAIFREAGFRTIACTWSNPMNIYAFAEAARREGAWGLLQTTWAGYNINESTLDRELKQFAAYVLAGQYAWSAGSPAPEKLPWRADEVLIGALERTAAPATPRAGFFIELPEMPTGKSIDWLQLKDMPSTAAGFRFAKETRHPVVLSGALLRTEPRAVREVNVKLAEQAECLAFLHATVFPADSGQEVGWYEVHFDDGSCERIPLRYAKEIRAWDDPAIARRAIVSVACTMRSGMPLRARVLVWHNPHPQKTIARVTFATDHDYASPMLLGISGVAPEP